MNGLYDNQWADIDNSTQMRTLLENMQKFNWSSYISIHLSYLNCIKLQKCHENNYLNNANKYENDKIFLKL